MNNNILKPFRLSQEKALKFGIISKINPKNKDLIEFEFLKVEEKEDGFIISIALQTDKEKKPKSISYVKKKIDPYKAAFLGWALLDCGHRDNDQSYIEKGKKLLVWAVYKDIDSCFPVYLLAKSEFLKERGLNIRFASQVEKQCDFFDFAEETFFFNKSCTFSQLFDALEKPDVFPNFYCLCSELSVNHIKEEAFLREGWKRFPHNHKISSRYISCLLKNDKDSRKGLEVLEKSKPYEVDVESLDSAYYLEIDSSKIIYQEFRVRSLLGDTAGAIEIIRDSIFSKELKEFLSGLVLYEKKDYAAATGYFIEAIEETKKEYGGVTGASLYYLLGCYNKNFLSNKMRIESVIDSLKLEDSFFIIDEIGYSYEGVAGEVLAELVENNLADEYKYKVKGLLAYIIYGDFLYLTVAEGKKVNDYNRRRLERGVDMAKEALSFYQGNKFLNELCSDFLYIDKKYDEAMKYALATLGPKAEIRGAGISVGLSDCSDDFLENYISILDEELSQEPDEDEADVIIAEYIKHYLLSDLVTLFNRKKYVSIANLYDYLNKLEGITLEERLKQEKYKGHASFKEVRHILECSFGEVKKQQKAKKKEDESKKEDEKGIKYCYHENNKRGDLKIGDRPPIFFSGKPALVLRYFYESRDLGAYKSCDDLLIDFKNTFPDVKIEMNSNDLRQIVGGINKRAHKTDKRIEEVIEKQKMAHPNPLRYRWKNN